MLNELRNVSYYGYTILKYIVGGAFVLFLVNILASLLLFLFYISIVFTVMALS